MNAEYTEHVYQEYHCKDYDPIHQREEIVRCRDCKRWESGDCDWNPYYDDPVDDQPDGFCSWAIRREA